MIDILYLAWNRKEFTHESLAALQANTDWSLVRKCWLYDDGSTDGTPELLMHFCANNPKAEMVSVCLRSPVGIMNHFLAGGRSEAEWFCKIDSDVILPQGWLPVSLGILMLNEAVDLLGLEAKYPIAGSDTPNVIRGIERTDHIGGVGLMRASVFRKNLPVANGRMGFSDWQIKNPDVFKAWLNPALPVILLDRLPFDPWRRLSKEYEARGWQRPWKLDDDPRLWQWWTK